MSMVKNNNDRVGNGQTENGRAENVADDCKAPAARGTPLVFASRSGGPGMTFAGSTPTTARRAGDAGENRFGPWKVLIADDDADVHSVTRLLLKDFSFDGRGLQFFDAGSGEDARQMMQDHPDTAVLLLDVVMESEHAGLEAVRYIREELGNRHVRIILRTGQPGYAPEKQVVEEYDINDYREKTELTAQKLVTSLMSALRAYRDIRNLDNSRKGLEQIIDASASLFEHQSLRRFAGGVLTQLTSLLNLSQDALYLNATRTPDASGLAATRLAGDFEVLAATGSFDHCVGASLRQVVADEVLSKLLAAAQRRESLVGRHDFVGYYKASTGSENLVYIQSRLPFNDLDVSLMRVFSAALRGNISYGPL